MKQTAVDWLIEQLENHNGVTKSGFENVIQQAIEKEKEQIMRSHSSGYNSGLENKLVLSYEYYIKTFKSE